MSNRRYVVFDTNVVEQRYLAPLLKGELCRDLEAVREAQFEPAAYIKSYYEICHHVKRGTKSFPWLTAECGYPGGEDRGRAISGRIPNASPQNFFWWFGLCEEWRGKDWEEERRRVQDLVRVGGRESALREVEARAEFARWKSSLESFCERVWDVLRGAGFTIFSQHDTCRDPEALFQIEHELALRTLVPSEDLEIVAGALAVGAAAIVTSDAGILSAAGLSLSLNYKTAFVHPDQLREAMDQGFELRWSREQIERRRG